MARGDAEDEVAVGLAHADLAGGRMAVGLAGGSAEITGCPRLGLLAHAVVGHQRAVVGAFERLLVEAGRHRDEAARAVEGAHPLRLIEHDVRVDERVADGAAGGGARVAHDHRTVGGDAGGIGFIARAEEA